MCRGHGRSGVMRLSATCEAQFGVMPVRSGVPPVRDRSACSSSRRARMHRRNTEPDGADVRHRMRLPALSRSLRGSYDSAMIDSTPSGAAPNGAAPKGTVPTGTQPAPGSADGLDRLKALLRERFQRLGAPA